MKKALLILLLIAMVSVSILTGTFALYTSNIDEISGDIFAKQFAFSIEKSEDFVADVKIAPTESVFMNFGISNKDGNTVSEVPMDIELVATLESASGKNLIPNLKMELFDDNNNKIGVGQTANGSGSIKFKTHFELSANEFTRNFKAKITWVSHDDDILYQGADFGNRIALKATATQCFEKDDHFQGDDDFVYPVDEETGFNGGKGTKEEPFVVGTADAFNNIGSNKTSNIDYSSEGKVFDLKEDIDLTGTDREDLVLINSDFNGNGNTITYKGDKPLFNRINGGRIKDVVIDGYRLVVEGKDSDKYFASGGTSIFGYFVTSNPKGKPLVFENVRIVNSEISITPSKENAKNAIAIGAFGAKAFFHDQNISFINCSVENTKLECTSTKASVGGFIGVVSKEKPNHNFIEFVDCSMSGVELFTGHSQNSTQYVSKISAISRNKNIDKELYDTAKHYFIENDGVRVDKVGSKELSAIMDKYYICNRYYLKIDSNGNPVKTLAH